MTRFFSKIKPIINNDYIMFFVLKILLEYLYIFYLKNAHSYNGYFLSFDIIKYVESTIMSIIIIKYMLREDRPSTVVYTALIYFLILPFNIVYEMQGNSRIYFYAVNLCFMLMNFLIRNLPMNLPSSKVTDKLNFKYFNIINVLIISLIYVYTTVLLNNGIPDFTALNFHKVYNVRDAFEYGYSINKYIYSWQSSIFNVILFYFALLSGKKRYIFVMTVLTLLIYLLTGFKSYLAYPVILVVLYVLQSRKNFGVTNIIKFLKYGMPILMVIVIFFNIIGEVVLPSIIVNRIIFLPAQITNQYYDYFSVRGQLLYSHSFLSSFFSEPLYNTHPIKLIGNYYYNDNWPNTGFLGDAYMNLGIIGMFVTTILMSIILKLIDLYSNNVILKNLSIIFLTTFTFTFINMGFFTSLLYGGLLVYITILIMLNIQKVGEQ